MRQDDRAPFDRALHRARVSAYGPGEFVGQESFMTRERDPGPGGAGRHRPRGHGAGPVLRRRRARAVHHARAGLRPTWEWTPARVPSRSPASARGDVPAASAVARIPPLPAGRFDVVLLLETMLAFEDKDALVRAVAATLAPGGRFAFTLEEGAPLTAAERAAMPDADTVWLTPLEEMVASLDAGRARRHVAGGPQPRARCGRRERWRLPSPTTPSRSRRRSAGGRWTSCSPLTGCGSIGSTRGGCGSSRSWRSVPRGERGGYCA